MVNYAWQRVHRGEPMAGLFIVQQEQEAPFRIVEDLLLLDDCSETAEWAGRVEYLPFR